MQGDPCVGAGGDGADPRRSCKSCQSSTNPGTAADGARPTCSSCHGRRDAHRMAGCARPSGLGSPHWPTRSPFPGPSMLAGSEVDTHNRGNCGGTLQSWHDIAPRENVTFKPYLWVEGYPRAWRGKGPAFWPTWASGPPPSTATASDRAISAIRVAPPCKFRISPVTKEKSVSGDGRALEWRKLHDAGMAEIAQRWNGGDCTHDRW